jgi:hypothetical protein
MHDIAMIVQCPDRWCEILPTDLGRAEYLVEELVAHVLSTLFQVVLIEDISLGVQSVHVEQDALITLSLHVLGCDPLSSATCDLFTDTIETRLSGALGEIFGLLHVQRFAVC